MSQRGDFPFPTSNTSKGPTNGPPSASEASPGQLFRKLTDMVRPHEVLPFPRSNDDGQPVGKYWLQVLTQAEVDDATIDAEKYIRTRAKARAEALGETSEQAAERPNQEAWREMFESARMVELIWRAARREEEPRLPLFDAPEVIRNHCLPAEITTIVNSYDCVQRKFGPLFKLLTAEEVEAWVEILIKGGEEAYGPFGLLSPGQLEQLLMSFARRFSRSATDKSSPGLQSDDGTSATSSQPSDANAEAFLDEAPAEPEFKADGVQTDTRNKAE